MATAHNTANNDTRAFEKAMLELGKKISCAHSIPSATGNDSFLVAERDGVVCRDVMQHAQGTIGVEVGKKVVPFARRITSKNTTLYGEAK